MGYVLKNVNFSISLSLTILKSFGFWLPDGSTDIKRLVYYSYGFSCFMFVLGLFIISQIVDLFLVWGDLAKMTATACVLFTNVAHSTKILNIIVRRPLIQTIIDNSHEELSGEISNEGKNIVKGCNFQTKLQQLLFYFITFLTLIGWSCGPEKGQLPFPTWYPFDASKSPAYEIAYSHQVIALTACGCLNATKDTLVAALIAQVHCRLRLLGLSLRTMCSDLDIPGDRLLSLKQEKVVKSRLRVCVIRHQAALEAADQLQQAFSEPTFIQFAVSLLIICVTAFQAVSQIGNKSGLISMGLYLVTMMYQLFIYCYQGNKLAEESTAVSEAAYAVPWYACRPPVRRSLILMSVRSRRAALLVAGGFTPLSLDSFMSITKASYSLFTLLRQVEERN